MGNTYYSYFSKTILIEMIIENSRYPRLQSLPAAEREACNSITKNCSERCIGKAEEQASKRGVQEGPELTQEGQSWLTHEPDLADPCINLYCG